MPNCCRNGNKCVYAFNTLLGNVVTVLYTIDNGGVLVLAAVYSVILFKEKIDKLKLFGIILATLSIVALALNAESIAALRSLN